MNNTINTSNTFGTGIDDWHVLVLHDGEEKDIRGIWGPYRSHEASQFALQELSNWPIDGQWSTFALKQFNPTFAQQPSISYRSASSSGTPKAWWFDPNASTNG